MKENMMSEEAFNELVNGFEYVATLTKYGRENMKYHIQRLQQENERLKEEVKAVNKGLRKVQQRSIKYKNRCLKLNEKIKKIKQPQMFIDTQDIEERYAEELYRDFLKEENKQLKKKLEEKENIACDWKDSCLENAGKIEILETQQKEFIKYLENMLDDENDIFSVVRVKDALQKYRETLGVLDEKK